LLRWARKIYHADLEYCRSGNIDMIRVVKGVYASPHLNFSNPSVAQRLPLELKRTDDELKSRDSQEIRRV